MEITRNNLMEVMNINFEGNEVHDVSIDCIVDAGLNPREVDIKYAEQIPLSAPPIVLGIINNDEELKNRLIIIDGNHRLYSYLNVHCIKTVGSIVKTYSDRSDAIIDAYKYNVNHGRRLSDKEIGNGIKKITTLLRKNGEDGKKTYTKLAELLNVSITAIYEYVAWERVENILGERIDKMKAARIHFFLKDQEKGPSLLKEFWSLNKDLSYRKLREAAKFYRETGVITDYEQYKIQSALLEEDDDDGIENEEVIKPVSLNSYSKNDQVMKPFHQDIEIPEDNFIVENHEIEEEKDFDDLDEEDDTVGYKYTSNSQELEVGRPVEVIQTSPRRQEPMQDTTEHVAQPIETEDNLVQVKGLVRKFSFETILGNIFDDLQEDVLNANSLLQETLEKYLHKNRDTFEKYKDEYLAILNNCNSVISKMEKVLNKANKDYKEN